jgi:ABC-type multidrug transport system fused ATPase/permease subunit
VAKRTPDYTKQVRHEKPRRQPVAAPGKKTRRGTVPPPQKGAPSAVYVALGGGTAVYLYAAFLATGGANSKAIIFSLVIALCGLFTNVLTGVLATYALYPVRHAMPRLDKRLIVVLIMVFGAVTVFFGLQIAWLAPGIIPPVAVFFFVVRPRLKLIAQAAGTYRPTKRDAALAEIDERRETRRRETEEREREKEKEEQLKRVLKRRMQQGDQAGDASGPGRSRWRRGS